MHILFTDETNRRPSKKAKFFVYGGLVFDFSRLEDLDRGISEIRRETGYLASDELKFDTNARPTQVTRNGATAAKRKVLGLCRELGARFIACVTLHEIIKNQDPDDQILWAANHVVGRFNRYLREVVDDRGICVVDNLPVKAGWKYLAEKFTKGLDLVTGNFVPLDRILLFAATCSNASHASSAMDIVLGSFRYCINDPANKEAAEEMMREVVELIWHDRDGEKILAMEKGLILRPLLPHITVEKYKQEYLDLVDHINILIAD